MRDDDMIYPLRIDRQVYAALQTLAENTDRTRAGYIRYVLRREVEEAGLVAPRPGEAQADRRGSA
jgi:hypothetical protein